MLASALEPVVGKYVRDGRKPVICLRRGHVVNMARLAQATWSMLCVTARRVFTRSETGKRLVERR